MNISDNSIIKLVNSVFDLTKKSKTEYGLDRNIARINDSIIEMGILVINPIGEKYTETRTDCEATIAGVSANNLHIVEVIKPIIYLTENNKKNIIQRGVVIVESK